MYINTPARQRTALAPMLLHNEFVLYNDGQDNLYHPQPDVRLTKVADWYVNPCTNVCERPWEVKWVNHNPGCKHD